MDAAHSRRLHQIPSQTFVTPRDFFGGSFEHAVTSLVFMLGWNVCNNFVHLILFAKICKVRAEIYIPKWARKIHILRRNELLVVTGESHYPFRDQALISAQSSGRMSRSMHIDFANSHNEDELVAFVKKYGPVQGSFVHGTLYSSSTSMRGFKKITVEQTMDRLREVQDTIAAGTCLVALLQLNKPIHYETANDLCRRLVKGLSLEGGEEGFKEALDFVMSGAASKKSIRLLAESETLAACDLLCRFLEKFPPRLGIFHQRIVELPAHDETGILPIISYLLRQDFLSEVRTIGICERCRRLFVVVRRGAQFCSAACSQLKRSLDYYHSRKAKLKKA
jgi:hypothetical protein